VSHTELEKCVDAVPTWRLCNDINRYITTGSYSVQVVPIYVDVLQR